MAIKQQYTWVLIAAMSATGCSAMDGDELGAALKCSKYDICGGYQHQFEPAYLESLEPQLIGQLPDSPLKRQWTEHFLEPLITKINEAIQSSALEGWEDLCKRLAVVLLNGQWDINCYRGWLAYLEIQFGKKKDGEWPAIISGLKARFSF